MENIEETELQDNFSAEEAMQPGDINEETVATEETDISSDKSMISSDVKKKIGGIAEKTKRKLEDAKSMIQVTIKDDEEQSNENGEEMKTYDDSVFKGIKNIDNVLKMNKLITLACIIAMPILGIVFMFGFISYSNKQSQEIYVLQSDGVDAVKKRSVKENRPVEIEMHMIRFYENMFNLDPDNQQIQESLAKAMMLGGKDIVRLINTYKEGGFYNQLIQENIFLRGEVDSVQVFADVYPYKAVVWGRQKFTRYSNATERVFSFSCSLKNTRERTRQNPHGLFIEKIVVLENKLLQK